MTWTPLDVSRMSAAAQKALAPGPMRMMAARGLAPLPPAEQISVLYQLAIDADSGIATAAKATAVGMPDKLLAGALGEPSLDPRVLDLFAQLVADKAAAFEAMVSNPTIGDPTIAALAAKANAAQIDRIAANEQRLLRHPEIIAAMYVNKQARMSTVDRVVELAVRNQVRVPGLAAWDEISRALDGAQPATAADDAAFAAAIETSGDDRALIAGDADALAHAEDGHDHALAKPDEEGKDVQFSKLSIPGKVRAASMGDAFVRGEAIRHPMRIVAMAAIKSGAVTDFEALRYAKNPGLSDDVIRFIAAKREWTKMPAIKYALCCNPKTPVADAIRMLPALRDKDLQGLAKSRGVPSAVVANAKKLMSQRRGGDKK